MKNAGQVPAQNTGYTQNAGYQGNIQNAGYQGNIQNAGYQGNTQYQGQMPQYPYYMAPPYGSTPNSGNVLPSLVYPPNVAPPYPSNVPPPYPPH
jgi:hypothetical protein